MYYLTVIENAAIDEYGPYKLKTDILKRRTLALKRYKGRGFTRTSDGDTITLDHAVFSSVVFSINTKPAY